MSECKEWCLLDISGKISKVVALIIKLKAVLYVVLGKPTLVSSARNQVKKQVSDTSDMYIQVYIVRIIVLNILNITVKELIINSVPLDILISNIFIFK